MSYLHNQLPQLGPQSITYLKKFQQQQQQQRQQQQQQQQQEEEEEEEEEGLFKADAVNEEDPERDRATPA